MELTEQRIREIVREEIAAATTTAFLPAIEIRTTITDVVARLSNIKLSKRNSSDLICE